MTEDNTTFNDFDSSPAADVAGNFEAAAERIRALNEKLLDTAKKTGNANLDAYEKALSTFVEFQQQVAGASQLDWVNTVVKAQTDFLSQISAAYTAAAREALK
jgi:hypothetical protein